MKQPTGCFFVYYQHRLVRSLHMLVHKRHWLVRRWKLFVRKIGSWVWCLSDYLNSP